MDGSQYFTANNTCYFPSEILFDILTTQTGLISNPLETVVAARISVKYNYITFDDVTTKQNVRMNFITSFIPLKEDVFAKKRSTPSILPGLPDDIATIFSLI